MNLLSSRDLFFKITEINEIANAMIAMTPTMLINVNVFSNADLRLHQLGFLQRKLKTKLKFKI